ncbi:XrtA-associated tyrosine autokinase [Flocculibacter collagenilyticus]|uniref:XrtA-associated tyrosine autokinase n=1 Tax=Flocculibacter collagenilyticus TaxID=2744479 RepID=UPI0018F5D30B|nr:XrtA-associated tyrosine autokinase [Flocculibacter collagenilyticus]
MSTIERALQKQREAAEKAKKESAAKQTDSKETSDGQSTIERAGQHSATMSANKEASSNEVKVEQSTSPAEHKEPMQSAPPEPESQDVSADALHNTGAESVPTTEEVAVKDSNNQSITSANKKTLFIDIEELERNGFVSGSSTRTRVNEEFRSIKRKLLNNAFGPLKDTVESPNVIMVSSATSNEGKTFCAANLALSIALEQDVKVLLVDADVIRPALDKVLNFNVEVGLVEYLRGKEKSVENIIYDTNFKELRIIPAGNPHHLTTELLASDKMRNLANEFARRYPDRIVIFDAPPMIGVNESAVLATFSGQILIVVEENKTQLSSLTEVTELLPKDRAVGFIVNKAIRSASERYGYY